MKPFGINYEETKKISDQVFNLKQPQTPLNPAAVKNLVNIGYQKSALKNGSYHLPEFVDERTFDRFISRNGMVDRAVSTSLTHKLKYASAHLCYTIGILSI
jgi:hypothetical protein